MINIGNPCCKLIFTGVSIFTESFPKYRHIPQPVIIFNFTSPRKSWDRWLGPTRPKAREIPNTKAPLADWERVTRPGKFVFCSLVLLNDSCSLPWRTVPIALIWARSLERLVEGRNCFLNQFVLDSSDIYHCLLLISFGKTVKPGICYLGDKPHSPNLSDLAECVILCTSWLQSPGKVYAER